MPQTASHLSDDDVVQLVTAIIDEDGLLRAAKRLDSSREALMRIRAGLRVRRGTLELVRAALLRERGVSQ